MTELRQFADQMHVILTGIIGTGTDSVTEQNTRLIRKLFEWYNADDVDSIVNSVTDDFELVDIPAATTYPGKTGLREWLGISKTALPNARTYLTNLIVTGNVAASEHEGRGTHTGVLKVPGGEIPPTGKTVDAQVAELYEFRDGKLARWRVYYDGAALVRQLLGDTPLPAAS
jgi:ketosteroid isomerase-like protein